MRLPPKAGARVQDVSKAKEVVITTNAVDVEVADGPSVLWTEAPFEPDLDLLLAASPTATSSSVDTELKWRGEATPFSAEHAIDANPRRPWT